MIKNWSINWYEVFILGCMFFGGGTCALFGFFIGFLLHVMISGDNTPVHILHHYVHKWFETDSFEFHNLVSDCIDFFSTFLPT